MRAWGEFLLPLRLFLYYFSLLFDIDGLRCSHYRFYIYRISSKSGKNIDFENDNGTRAAAGTL